MSWIVALLWLLGVCIGELLWDLPSFAVLLLLLPVFIFVLFQLVSREGSNPPLPSAEARKLNFASDRPIESGGDKLNRTRYVKVVAEKINTHDASDGLVIGLHAPWGAGKTSFVNLLKKQLNDCEIIILEPWSFTNTNQVASQLFESLYTVAKKYLVDKEDVEEFKKLIPYLELAALHSSDLPIPLTTKIAIKFAALFLSAGSDATQADRIKQARDRASSILKKVKKNIVVIIDDLDRLESEEVKQILKLVKASADFSNVIYLLPCDRKIISKQISYADGGIVGSEYLKKIIQVDLTLPVTDKEYIYKVLYDGLNEILKEIYGEEWDFSEAQKKRWNEIFHFGFKELFQTIRDCHRYLNSVSVNFSCVSIDDVDTVDFLAIEALRVFSPEYYDFIGSNKNLFIRDPLSFRDKQQFAERFKSSLMLGVPDEISGIVKDVIKKLFPDVDDKATRSDHAYSEQRRDRLICTDKFDFYFSLDIPFGEVSDASVKRFLTNLADLEKAIETVANWIKNDQFEKALKAIPFYLEGLQEEYAKVLILCVWSVEKLAKAKGAFFGLEDVETLNNRIVWNVLKQLPKDKRKAFLTDLSSNQKELYPKVRLAHSLVDDVNQFINKKSVEEPILEKNEADELFDLVTKDIESSLANGELLEERRPIYLLYRLKEKKNDDTIEKALKAMVSSKGLLHLLNKFRSTVRSTAGDYEVISVKEARELLGQDFIDEELKKIDESALSSDEKNILQIYNKSVDHPWF